jgi:hypothetical protein
MKIRRFIASLVAITTLALSGCAGLSQSLQSAAGVGSIKSSVSGFDGKTEISMENAWVANEGGGGIVQIGMAFRWNSASPNKVGIIVQVTSLNDFSNISSATLNLDDAIEQLEPVEALTTHEWIPAASMKSSDKMFIADLSLVRRMLTAKSLKIKVSSGRDYRVGDLRKDSFGNIVVKDKLPEFVAEIDKAIRK